MTRLLLLIATLTTVSVVSAAAKSRWEFPASPYFWLYGLDGDVTIAGAEDPVKLKYEDIFEDLSWGLAAHVEAKRRQWSILFDVNYKNLKPGDASRLLDMDVWLLEGGAAYNIGYGWEILGGARFFGLRADEKVDEELVGSADESWVDPIVGGRFTWPFKKNWSMTTRVDIGGFGVGSSFSWNAIAGVTYRTMNTSFFGGYRIWSVDYENGSGDDRFAWDIISAGPGIGMTFHL